MRIVEEERIQHKSVKEHSSSPFPALKMAENFQLFQHFEAETLYVKQEHLRTANFTWLIRLLRLVYQ